MQQEKPQIDKIQHLFDAQLQYQEGLEALVPADEREGVLIGSGDGTVSGPRFAGTIRWSMYSEDCAYLLVKAGLEPPPGSHLCTVNPAGVIETYHGAEIWFDAKGFGLRGYDPSSPHIWQLTMGLRFETQDDRYLWLNTTLAMWQGRFDERAGQAAYQAYAQFPEETIFPSAHRIQ